MSSYLNFYIVPRKREGAEEEPKPLCLMSYSRNSPVYQHYSEIINPVFIGNDDEYKYTELTLNDVDRVVNSVKEDLENVKKRFDLRVSAYKELGKDVDNDAIDDFTSTKEYIQELEDEIKELQFIANIIHDIFSNYTDFEKVYVNVD